MPNEKICTSVVQLGNIQNKVSLNRGVLLDGIKICKIALAILVVPAMIHYHKDFNWFVALVVVPIGYAGILAILAIFREQLKENKLSLQETVDIAKLGFSMGMLLPGCIWFVKVVYPLIIWLTTVCVWLVVHIIHQPMLWIMNI